MDEKKLYRYNVMVKAMNRQGVMKSVAFMFMFMLLTLLVSMSTGALAADIEPYDTMDSEIKSYIAGIQLMQVGGDAVLLRVRGEEMPLPRQVSAPGENKLILQWDEARFPRSTEKRDWWDDYEWDILKLGTVAKDKWWKQYDLPLVSRVNAEPIDEKSLRLTFTTNKPLVISKVDGLAGADNTAVMLKVYEAEKPAKAPAAPKPFVKGDPMTIKAPVTLALRDAELKSVFRMLAEQQNINLLLDPSVPDMSITFRFEAVPFHEAFSYLLRMSELTYSVVGGTLVVGKQESIGRTLGREVVRAYPLSYATDDSGNIKGDFVAALTGLVSLSKPPTLDQRTRTVYVTATPEQHTEIAELIAKLDHPGRQVLLQAKIMEVNDDGQQELETLISAVYDQWLMNFSSVGLGAGYNYANTGFSAADLGFPIPGRVPGDEITWDNMTLNAGQKYLGAGLRAIESKGKGKIMAQPSVITIDGQEAKVELTRNYKYASGVDSNGNTTFSDVESGPQLSFTPVIGRNGIITIKIEIETGEVIQFRNAGNGAQAPETSSRKVETIVRVRNGEPFAVGGLYQETKTKQRSRIPVIGYIPLLGDLFTYRSDNHNKSEVAMIVIPYILDVPDEDISTFDLKKSSLIH